MWMIVAILFILIGLIGSRLWEYWRKAEQQSENIFQLCASIKRPAFVGAIILLGVFTHDTFRNIQLNPFYFSDDVIPYHMRWHSAWIGMTLHPRWSDHVPYPELAKLDGDTLPFTLFQLYMEKNHPGTPVTSPTTGGLQKIRMHEEVARRELLKFARKNPIFMLELYSWYKPVAIANLITRLISSIALAGWLAMIPVLLAAGWLAAGTVLLGRSKLIWVLGVTLPCALLPPLWAYPAPHAFSDQFYAVNFVGLSLAAILLAVVLCRGGRRRAPSIRHL
jgi:hypothetical protein